MSHTTVRASYRKLVDRLNRFPQGAPPSELLYRILGMLFSEKEAGYVSLLPIKPFKARTAARLWRISEGETRKILENLAGRGILVDIEKDGESTYALPPPMAGFFEFSLMRIRDDIDQKALSKLLYQYLNVEDEFIKALFVDGETQLGRVLVQERALSPENALHVLDHERASEVIRTAKSIGIGVCYCRHKMEHLDRACDAPKDICMTFNGAASSLMKHGIVRCVDEAECLDLLDSAYEHDLVQFGENVRAGVSFICNCCGCCCEALIAARRFGLLNPVHTTNFIPQLEEETCTGCGKCVDACPVEAMSLVSLNDPRNPKKKKTRLHAEICLGCGICVKNCPADAIRLLERERRVITPLNTVHRTVVMAIERGKLQHLIFDNGAMWNHRAMAAVLGVILKLPPVKQALASTQVKSRYLEYLISRLRLPV